MYCTGENRTIHHGNPGIRLKYFSKEEKNVSGGQQVIITQRDSVKNLRVDSYYEFNDASPVVRRYTIVTNEGDEDVGIEYLSSAMLNNYHSTGEIDDNIRIYFAYNSWARETQWKKMKPSE